MQLTYTVAFNLDLGEDDLSAAVLEKDRFGEVRLVNILMGDDVRDIFEALTGRDPEDM